MRSRVGLARSTEIDRPSLKTNTAWAMLAEASQLVFGLVVLFASARALGDEQYGRMAGVLAVALVLASLSQLGAQQLLMLDHAAGREFRLGWGRTLTLVLGGGTLALLVCLPFQPLIAPSIGRSTFILLFASQSMAFAVTDYCVIAAQAHRQLRSAFFIRLGSGVIRAGTAAAFLALGGGRLESWAWLALGSWCLVAICSLALVQRVFRVGRPVLGVSTEDARRGVPFSLNAGSSMFLDSSDRTMLVAYGFDGPAGRYTAGARMATLGVLPLMALVRASDFDFYELGQGGVGEARRFATRLVALAAGYGALAALGILLIADVPELLLGERFAGTATVLRWFAILPLLRGLQVFAGNALTASGHQNHRTAAIASGAVLNFSANLYLIPRYDWRGAAISTLVAECFLAIVLWAMLQRLAGRNQSRAAR